ncbi:CHRD domain-containing protein [Candidatus Nitrosocosmicus sp. T]
MHIHYGIEGENGPITVTLFKYDNPQNQVLERGTIMAENLTGPLQGMQVSDLIDEFNQGTTYANIHTE